MFRYLFLGALVIFSVPSVQAADRNQMFQNFMDFAQQLQQMEQQQQQEQELLRQKREAFIHQMVTSCIDNDEVACRQIIDTEGMSPYANYTAFLYMGDIELQRGAQEAARSNYLHAKKWAARMQDGANAWQTATAKLAAIKEEEEQTPSQTAPSDNDDLVCDAAGSTKWKIACLQASEDAEGAKLYAALGDTLRQYNTTLRALLDCEAMLTKQPDAGMRCYSDRGLSGTSLKTVRQYALEYDLLIDERLSTKR